MREREPQTEEEFTPEMEAKLVAEGFHVLTSYNYNDQKGLNTYTQALELAKRKGKQLQTTWRDKTVKLWVK